VSEVLTALGNKMEMEKRQSVGVAPDHVWQNLAVSPHHVRLPWSGIVFVEVQAIRRYWVEQDRSHPKGAVDSNRSAGQRRGIVDGA
jgi:hypothetical protein